MKKSYGTARAVLSFLEAVGWLMVIAGGILAFAAFMNSNAGISGAIIFGGGITVVGLFNVALVQIARAQVDTAENTAAATELLARIAANSLGSAPRGPGQQGGGYMRGGRIIKLGTSKYKVGDQIYDNLTEAEAEADRMG